MSRASKMLILGMFFIIIAYNIIDAYQTYWLLKAGLTELNPIVNFFISKFGMIAGMILVKSAALMFLALAIILAIILENRQIGGNYEKR